MKLHIVPPRQGAIWVRLGIRVFMKQPLAMSGLFFMFIAMISLLSLVPVIGIFMALTALPAATLGYMAATHEALTGRFPMPILLLSALKAGRDRMRSMMVLGLWYALAFLGIMGLSVTIDGGAFASIYLLGAPIEPDVLNQASVQFAMYLSMALYLPVSLGFWHAPALIHWHGLSPAKSVFFSLVACMRNFKAFAVFGMMWFGLMLGAGLLVSVLAELTGSSAVVSVLMMPVILMVASMFFASLFFTFHDCFIIDRPNPTSQPPSGVAP